MTAAKKPRRQYRRNGKRLPSVTTIIGMADKPALLPWAAGCGARAYARELAAGYDHEQALQRARSSWAKERDEAIEHGTRAHAMLEAWARDEEIVADLDNENEAIAHRLYRAGVDHLEATGATVIASEVAITGQDLHGPMAFGGTFDLALERSDGLWLADWKTGRRVYGDSVVPQLAAYRELWRWFDLTWAELGDEADAPRLRDRAVDIAGALVLHIPIDGPVTEVRITNDQLTHGWEYFKACYQLWSLKPGLTLDSDDVKNTEKKESTDE